MANAIPRDKLAYAVEIHFAGNVYTVGMIYVGEQDNWQSISRTMAHILAETSQEMISQLPPGDE